MNITQTIILSVVEGLTEFLPISSTGHMVIVSSLMSINENEFTKIFEVNIQFGAILSVLVLYWKRFIVSFDFYKKLLIGFLPVAFIGFALNKYIDAILGNVIVVAITLLLGGIILLFIDNFFEQKNQGKEDNEVTYKKALAIGFFQCIAMIPGVSRSAATIIGGQAQGLDRKTAAEFSFFLAVPTMFAASSYKLLKGYKAIHSSDLLYLVLGNIVAFIVATLAIKFFIDYLTKHGFKAFGYYRIFVGLILLIMFFLGVKLEV